MFLSDRDLEFALKTGQLIVVPPPAEFDTTCIDLHLDKVEQAKVWDVSAFLRTQQESGNPSYLGVGQYNWKVFAEKYTQSLREDSQQSVYRDGRRVIIKPHGFFLWQTLEVVGTPEVDPRLICFLDGRSSIARTGLLVHMTAPTIHAGWWGQITLEIANLGPFDIALSENDSIAQIVVAAISSPPKKRKNARGINQGQANVLGQGNPSPPN
jgi:dCTP deaminase